MFVELQFSLFDINVFKVETIWFHSVVSVHSKTEICPSSLISNNADTELQWTLTSCCLVKIFVEGQNS